MLHKLCLILTLFVLCGFKSSLAQPGGGEVPVETKIGFCSLPVPQKWQQANSDFYVMYTFKLDSRGKFLHPKKVRNEVVQEEDVTKCVANWSLLGLREPLDIAVKFQWKHGFGWIEQVVSTKGFRHELNNEE